MIKNREGFTLIEMLVAVIVASIVSAIIYSAYVVQMDVYQEQENLVQVQQNIRSAMAFLQRESRMAGFNPTGEAFDRSCSADPASGPAIAPGIHTATVNTFGFSMDLNGDGDCADVGENVLYRLYVTGGVQHLGRNDLTTKQAQQSIADNIDALEFIYLFAPPRVGSPVSKLPTAAPDINDLEDIRTIQVSMLVRAGVSAKKKEFKSSYTLPLPDAWGNPRDGGTVINVPDDNFRHRLLSSMINLRNRGF